LDKFCKIKDFEGNIVSIYDMVSENVLNHGFIINHILICESGCTLDKILSLYLNKNVGKEKSLHKTIRTLCRMAVVYEKLGASPHIVRKFFIRSANIDLIRNRKDLDSNELFEALTGVISYWKTRECFEDMNISSHNYMKDLDLDDWYYLNTKLTELESDGLFLFDSLKDYIKNMNIRMIMNC